jgi:hypothetical protein
MCPTSGWITTSARDNWAAAIFACITLTDWKIVSSVVSGMAPAPKHEGDLHRLARRLDGGRRHFSTRARCEQQERER